MSHTEGPRRTVGQTEQQEAQKASKEVLSAVTRREIAEQVSSGEYEDNLLKMEGAAALSVSRTLEKALPGEDVSGVERALHKKITALRNVALQEADKGVNNMNAFAMIKAVRGLNRLANLDSATVQDNIDTGFSDFSGDFDIDDPQELASLADQIAGGSIKKEQKAVPQESVEAQLARQEPETPEEVQVVEESGEKPEAETISDVINNLTRRGDMLHKEGKKARKNAGV